MFGWGKKSDGFQWHKYVRTTIKLKRDNRRQKVENVKQAAADQVQAAGAAVGAGARVGAEKVGKGVSLTARGLFDVLSRPDVSIPLALAGLIAGTAGILRWKNGMAGTDTYIALALGLTLLLGTVPLLMSLKRVTLPRLNRFQQVSLLVGAGLTAALAWAANQGHAPLAAIMPASLSGMSMPQLSNFSLTGAKPLEGRAQVTGTDTLRVGTTSLRLAGIEAPDRDQKCNKSGGKKFACGEAARGALERIVRNKPLTCTLGGKDETGRQLATCAGGGQDVAAQLVKEGHVFAEAGLFSKYGSQETEARTAKAGLWGGDNERPSALRAKQWDVAKKAAPDGCPIKGSVSSSGKTYVLPWSPDYESVKVRTSRGERWFCSEAEAQSAGWKQASRS